MNLKKHIILISTIIVVLCIQKSCLTVNEIFNDYIKEKEIATFVSNNTLENNIDKLTTPVVLDTYYGKLTGYGPDCYGCVGGLTATGNYVGDGNIYYDDPTYGKVRIIAADPSFPFGTIIRISNINYSSEPIYAIVLDRGGAIGFNRHALFDLLFETEKSTSLIGLEKNACFQVLRYGY